MYSLHDLDLFNLNTASNIDPDLNIISNQKFSCQYFSHHSFHVFKTGFSSTPNSDSTFSLFHNNVRSLERYFEKIQTHLLNEFDYHFNVVGITETRILQFLNCRNSCLLYLVMNLNLSPADTSYCWKCRNVH